MRGQRIAIIGGGVLLLLVVAALAAIWLIDINGYRPQIQALLRERLNRDVTIGRIALSVVPFGVRVENSVIAEAPAFPTGRPFARVGELYVSPSLLPLLRGRFELRAVELRQPEIEIVRSQSGAWNFSSLGSDEPSSSDSSLLLTRLTISAGQVAFTDQTRRRADAARAVYRNIDLELTDYAPDQAFGVVLAATLPGDGAQRVSLRGTAGPAAKQDAAMTPFDGAAQLDQVSVAGVQRFLALEALTGTDAVISGTASVRNQQGILSADGSVRFDRTRVRGVAIGYPISLDFDMTHAAQSQMLTIERSKLLLDKTPLSLTGTVDLQPETPVLDIHVTASDARLAEAARLASAFGVAFGAGTTVDGMANADVRARGPANAPALDGTVGLRTVSIAGTGIDQPVTTAAIDLVLTPAEIRSNEFSIGTGGTTVGVRAAVTRYTTSAPLLDVRVRANGDLGKVLDVAHAWGVGGVDGMSGSGPLSLDVTATGPVDRLTFAGRGTLTSATLSMPALTQPLFIRTAQLTFTRDSAILNELSASIGSTNASGRMTVRNFSAPQLDFQVSATRIDVREMQQLMATPPASAPSSHEAPAEDSILKRTTGTGRLSVGSIAYDSLLLEHVEATATLDRGLIRLSPVTAALFGGRHTGAIAVDTRRTPMLVTMASELERVDANRLVSSTTSLKDMIHGALDSTVTMSFAGDSADSIAKSLNGSLSLNLADGTIANMDLRSEIANIARFASGQPQVERATSVAGFRGTFDIVNGLARTDNLTASIEGGTMGATGTVNLADQSLNMRITAVLSSAYSQQVGGSRVGGFMNTALANEQGELVVPMLVTGTMAKPRFAPDVQRVAEMKLKSLVPSLRNPGSLTRGILGAVTGRQPESSKPATPPENETAPSAETSPPADRRRQIEDVLGDLLRRRKPAEEKPADPPAAK